MNAFVHIIESPSALDLLDGRTEGRALGEALRLASIPHVYNLATSKETLRLALGTRLVDAWKNLGKLPIIHLSMHGNSGGVQLSDGEFLKWNDLRIELMPLLNAMQGDLLVCMSSCSGSSGCRMAMYEDSVSPFWALVGNSKDTAWSDAAVAYVTFYHLFFKLHSLEQCVEAMKIASGNKDFEIFSGRHIKEGWAQNEQKRRNNAAAVGRALLDLVAHAGGSIAPTPPFAPPGA